jgi:chorismate synthase
MTYTMLTVPQTISQEVFKEGISNGMDIYFTVAFKPVATIMQKQESLDNKGNITEMTGKGRHDPCGSRAVPIIEAMAAIVLADFYLINKTYNK